MGHDCDFFKIQYLPKKNSLATPGFAESEESGWHENHSRDRTGTVTSRFNSLRSLSSSEDSLLECMHEAAQAAGCPTPLFSLISFRSGPSPQKLED